jgi:hypothetical protein
MKDLKGQKFGRLTVIEDTGKRTRFRSVIWLCQCDCGNFTDVRMGNLTGSPFTESCGCLRVESNRRRSYKHGGTGTKLYGVWLSMKSRCSNLRDKVYKYYGGRGVKVCGAWRNDFIPFRAFALAHGYKKGLSIDRIDNDGNYEPSNVQFITRSENVAKANKLRKGK